MKSESDFLVFYSWQSDLPQSTNQKAIRNGLRSASSLVEENENIKVVIDEATRDEAGSPNIPASIIKKISACDVFVCDLTTINSTSDISQRRTPNPNVLFELGYAVATLGWGRVIMLFNKHFGTFPEDLPFDIDRHRASPYLLSTDDHKNKSNINDLKSLLNIALSAVISKSPLKPYQVAQNTPEQIKRIRDIENLTWALSTIHIPTIDNLVTDLPQQINGRVFHFYESFKGVVTNSLFHLYDSKSMKLIGDVYLNWTGCVNHGEEYRMANSADIYSFSNLSDAPLTDSQQEKWNTILSCKSKLSHSLNILLSYIRTEYLELNIDELSKDAWNEYVTFEKAQVNAIRWQ